MIEDTPESAAASQEPSDSPPAEPSRDAYWTWDPIEYVPPLPRQTVSDLLASKGEAASVADAIGSFETADSEATRARVIAGVLDILGPNYRAAPDTREPGP